MPVNPLRMCANLTADLRIQLWMCANLCKPVRECSLFAYLLRICGARARMCANVRECARMCANPRMCANAALMCAKVRECVKMRLCTSANVSRMCANAPANVCECSRICRECLRKHAVSADETGHVSRLLVAFREPFGKRRFCDAPRPSKESR